MKELFGGFYRPSNSEFHTIWETAIFVLDANILLNMYRYPKEAQEQLLLVLEGIASRLWVPHQSALEFQRNRLTIIAEQKTRFSDVRKILESSKASMANELEKLQLKKRHSSIKPDELILAIEAKITEFLTNLEPLEASQLGVTDEDSIRAKLDKLLQGKIGKPYSQDEINEIYKEGESRFIKSIPPGYKDAKKEAENKSDIFSYGGVVYQRKFGDLVLWKQIIQKSFQDSIEAVIFLTDDEKEDWWWIIDSQGKKKIGPRPELTDEIIRETSQKTKYFYMYNLEQFLKYSNEYLNTSITEESISQVREVAKDLKRIESDRYSSMRESSRVVEQAVFRWLRKRYENCHVFENEDIFPDYKVYNLESNEKLGFEIKAIQHPESIIMRLRDQQYRGYYEVKEGSLDQITFIFVADNEEVAIRSTKLAKKKFKDLPSGINFVIGIVTEDKKDLESIFLPVSEFNT
jgi:PIN like domain